jgi:hypothetical protein
MKNRILWVHTLMKNVAYAYAYKEMLVSLLLCFITLQAMKAYLGSYVTPPLILNLGTRYRWVVGFTMRPF